MFARAGCSKVKILCPSQVVVRGLPGEGKFIAACQAGQALFRPPSRENPEAGLNHFQAIYTANLEGCKSKDALDNSTELVPFGETCCALGLYVCALSQINFLLCALTLQLHPRACKWTPGCPLSAQVAICCELAGGYFGGLSKSAKRSADERGRLSIDI
eukprot:243273-Pelagomonas_calceolata.AAC.8